MSNPCRSVSEAYDRLTSLGAQVELLDRDNLVDGHVVSDQDLISLASGVQTREEIDMYFSRGR